MSGAESGSTRRSVRRFASVAVAALVSASGACWGVPPAEGAVLERTRIPRAAGYEVPDPLPYPGPDGAGEGEVAPAEAAPPEPVPTVETSRWDVLAECESHGEWDYNEHSGWGSGLYDGGLQFDPNTWTAHGGGEFAPTADRATREQQIAIAERVLASSGWGAWPACTRELGWR